MCCGERKRLRRGGEREGEGVKVGGSSERGDACVFACVVVSRRVCGLAEVQVAQQLDRLLHPCPRRWSDLHQQQYTSPAYVAQRLVVLRTLFPDDVDVLRLVSVHPEILDAPDEMVQAFMSRVRPLG